MRFMTTSCFGLVLWGVSLLTPAAPGKAASGTLTLGGKAIPLSHVVAYDAGAFKLVLITEQDVPREKIKSEFNLMKYNFEARPTGLVLWLDSANKLTRANTMLATTMVDVTSEIDLALEATPAGRLSGTLKSKPAATKLKLDASFDVSTRP